ncbi:MAG: type II toxin-antitoxin system RelE/ParE family toxin [Pyrinomonadaceae bacterium]
MARLIWTEKAVNDLDDISEFIAFDNPAAARRLVDRVTSHVDQLVKHPLSGPIVADFPGGKYRQIIEHPCRIIYRYDDSNVIVLRVLRTERLLRPSIVDDWE